MSTKAGQLHSYPVVAKRKGYEDERLRVTDVGYYDPTLYPELAGEIERRLAEEAQRRRELEQPHRDQLGGGDEPPQRHLGD